MKRIQAIICVLLLICLNSPLLTLGVIADFGNSREQIAEYLPSVSVGQPLPSGYSVIDIGNFLSHVLDISLDAAAKNLGYIWNRIVDQGYCPGNLDSHRHSFKYGLTSTNLQDGVNYPSTGYYCYCENCGQMAGELIEKYIDDANIQEDGSIIIYPDYFTTGYHNTFISNIGSMSLGDIYPFGVNFLFNNNGYASGHVTYYSGYMDTYMDMVSGHNAFVYIFDIENYNNIQSYVIRSWWTRRVQYLPGSYTINYNPPQDMTNSWTSGFLNDQYLVSALSWVYGSGSGSNEIGYNNYYSNIYPVDMVITLGQEDLNTNFNFDNIEAPVAYINNGTLIYGGYSSSIVDQSGSTFNDPFSNLSFTYDDSDYDYTLRKWTLNIPDWDGDGTTDNTEITIQYTDDGIIITTPDGTNNLFYITNPSTPIYEPSTTGVTTGKLNLDGTVNITVNQTSTTTNAYITTHEDIPEGIRDLRENLAQMYDDLPGMFGDFTDFLQEGFGYLPSEITTILIFGVNVAVFVGIFKLFWR